MKESVVVVSFQSLTAKSGAGMAKFGYYISKALHEQGLLQHFVVHAKGKFTTPFPSVPVSFWSRYYLRLLSMIVPKTGMKNHRYRLLQERLFDWFCCGRINAQTKVLIATQPFLERTFQKAKRLGITTVFIPGTAEENFIHDIVASERKVTGIGGEDAYTDPERVAFYNRSVSHVDIVAAPFSVVYDSYKASAFRGKVEALYGYLKPEIPTGPSGNQAPTFKVGYLAHTVLLKGLHYLLQAWQHLDEQGQLHPGMELHIAGGMDEDMKPYIERHFANLKQVVYTGHTSNVAAFYQSLDLFVVPSLTDGTPYTAIEAAMNGVPVVLTENCGTRTFLNSDNETGCVVVPIRDAGAIRNAILDAYTHRAASRAMGERGRQQVERYDPNEYVARVVDFTRQLLNTKS